MLCEPDDLRSILMVQVANAAISASKSGRQCVAQPVGCLSTAYQLTKKKVFLSRTLSIDLF